MSLFSSVHQPALVDQFWTRGHAHCPHDGSPLSSQFHSHSHGYLLALACMTCGKKVQVTRYSDPHRFSFRPWSADEIAVMVVQVEAAVKAVCPICQTVVQVRSVSGNSFRFMECLRCGNMHYFPYSSVVDELSKGRVAESLAS